MRRFVAALLFLATSAFALSTWADGLPENYWPRWRGPDAHGAAAVNNLPADWSDGKSIAWKAAMPGIGCSTPVVWGEQILLTSPVRGDDALLSYDLAGKKLWQTSVGPERAGKHRNGSGSNPSPATDGKYIFAYFKSGSLGGFDMKGKLLWKTNLQDRFAKDTLYWDLGTSPVLTNGHVIVAVMHKGDSFVAAFDKATGELAWKTPRNYTTPVEGDHSYATPIVIEHHGKQQIIVWGAEHLTAYEAQTGKLIWECGGFNEEKKCNWVAVASPVIVGDMVVVPYGRGSHVACVKLGGKGDVTNTHRIWTREDTGSFVPSPTVFGDRVIFVRDQGAIECIDPKTGETMWTAAFPKNRNKFYSSPMVADGKLYAAREDGVVLVAQIEGDFKLLAQNDMKQRVIASPTPLPGRILIRGEEELFSIGKE